MGSGDQESIGADTRIRIQSSYRMCYRLSSALSGLEPGLLATGANTWAGAQARRSTKSRSVVAL